MRRTGLDYVNQQALVISLPMIADLKTHLNQCHGPLGNPLLEVYPPLNVESDEPRAML